MITLFKHLRETGNVSRYAGLLLKRHRPILAYIALTLAIVVGLDRSRDSAIKRVEQTVKARCEATNDFRRNTNVQFRHFVDHNNAAVVLFRDVGVALTDKRTDPRFQSIGREFLAASDYYEELSKHFRDVPLEDCDKAVDVVSSGD